MCFIYGLIYVFFLIQIGLLLWESREANTDLCDLDYDDPIYYYASYWFIICQNALQNFRQMLSHDDVMAMDKVTQTRESRAIDEVSFTSQYRHKQTYLYIVSVLCCIILLMSLYFILHVFQYTCIIVFIIVLAWSG